MKPAHMYRALLRLYPRAFQKRFGAEMLDTWQQLHALHQKTKSSTVVFWARTLADTFANAGYQHITKELTMGRVVFGKLSVESVYITIGILCFGALLLPVVMGLLEWSGQSPMLSGFFVLALLLVFGLIVLGVSNVSYILRAPHGERPKLRRIMLVYAAVMVVLFFAVWNTQDQTLTLLALLAAPALTLGVFGQPFIKKAWVATGALALSGLLIGAFAAALSTDRLDDLLFTESGLARAEQRMCQKANPQDAPQLPGGCVITVQGAKGYSKEIQ